MEAQEVITRFCCLQAKVYEVFPGFTAADCFCGKSGLWGTKGYGPTHKEGYRNDGEILEFIEKAVEEKLEELKNGSKRCATQPKTAKENTAQAGREQRDG